MEVFLVRIFPHSDWIRRDTPCLSVFSPNSGKYGLEKTPYLDTFHAVRVFKIIMMLPSLKIHALLTDLMIKRWFKNVCINSKMLKKETAFKLMSKNYYVPENIIFIILLWVSKIFLYTNLVCKPGKVNPSTTIFQRFYFTIINCLCILQSFLTTNSELIERRWRNRCF